MDRLNKEHDNVNYVYVLVLLSEKMCSHFPVHALTSIRISHPHYTLIDLPDF